jgi:hypothetical protein
MFTFGSLGFYVVMGVVILGGIYARLALRKYGACNGKTVESIRPDLRGIRWKYTVLLVIVFCAVVVASFGTLIYTSWDRNLVKVFVPALLSISLFEAVFALVTGVYPNRTSSNWDSFMVGDEEEFRKVAWTQIGIIGLLSACAIAFL